MLIRGRALLCTLIVLPILASAGLAQTSTRPILSGQIEDAESGVPLSDAIVFVENSSLGTSSDPLGRFLLEFVPAGECYLVVSRVGYVRHVVHLSVKEGDSLSIEVKLVLQPVSITGVEVRAEGVPRTEGKPFLFFPTPSQHTYNVYGNNTSLPLGILFTDSALYMCALDTAIIDSEKYIRLWLLTKNLSDKPSLFDPITALKLEVSTNGTEYAGIAPMAPSEMMISVPKRVAMDQFSARIQATMDALLLIHHLIRPGYIRLLGKNIDAREGTEATKSGRLQIDWNLGKYPSLMGTSTEYLAQVFQGSLHAGILKQYTISPENSVDGFVYFPFPGIRSENGDPGFLEALQSQFALEILTPSGKETMHFTAN